MLFGPPLRLLFQAHRSGLGAGLGVHGDAFWASLVLERRRVVSAAGVPGLLADLARPRFDVGELNGMMSHDMEIAIRAGHDPREVMDAVEASVGRFLAGLAEDERVSAHLDPSPNPPGVRLPLRRSAVALLARALPTLRPAERLVALYAPDKDRLVAARVPDDQGLADLDPITLRTLRLVRQPVALAELAARSGRGQPQRTAHFWLAFDLLHQLGLLEILGRGNARVREAGGGGWERGVSRPPPLAAPPPPRGPRAAPPLAAPPPPPMPRAAPPLAAPIPPTADRARRDSLDEGVLEAFEDDTAEVEALFGDPFDDDAAEVEALFGDPFDGPGAPAAPAPEHDPVDAAALPGDPFDGAGPEHDAFDDAAALLGDPFDDDDEPSTLSLRVGEPASLKAEELADPALLLQAVDRRAAPPPEGGLMSLIQDGDDPPTQDTWPGAHVQVEDPEDEEEDVEDPVSEIAAEAAALLDGVAPGGGGPPTPVDPEKVLELAALCGELNPLAILDMSLDQLDGLLTLDGLREAFGRERRRFAPALYRAAAPEVQEAVLAVDEILRSSREALGDPAILAMWVRGLRAYAGEHPPPPPEQLARARQHFEAAQAMAWRRDWTGAGLEVAEATRLWPGQPRVRLLRIFCEVALRRLSPSDGVFNIDAMWLSDPSEMALAQVTAGRLLKAGGKRALAVARFRAALELDPGREDAARELAAARQ